MSQADDLEALVPGAELTHLITLTAAPLLPAAQAILAEVALAGATLKALSLGDGGVQRLQVTGIATPAARALTARLAAAPGVTRASVEHHLGRVRSQVR